MCRAAGFQDVGFRLARQGCWCLLLRVLSRSSMGPIDATCMLQTCVEACLYLHTHACVSVCVWIHMNINIYIYTYIYICMYVCIHIQYIIYINFNIYIYIYIYIYIHIYILCRHTDRETDRDRPRSDLWGIQALVPVGKGISRFGASGIEQNRILMCVLAWI